VGESASRLMITVALTCFNEGPYIGAAVRSVLAQTRSDLVESIIIADDGSDPKTVATLREIEAWDSRIKVLYGRGGNGLPAQRNLAFSHGQGTLLAILDGDDLWAPRKLELQLPHFDDASVGLSYTGYFTFEGQAPVDPQRAPVRDVTDAADLTRHYFLNDPPIIPSTTLMRRSAFEACGGFDASIRVFEDSDLYIRLSRTARFAFLPEPLLYKRTRAASITGGRRDLLAHHALVALKAAADEPRLLPLVARRLAERARKLGNQRLLAGDVEDARRLLRFGRSLDPLNAGIWASLVAAAFPRPARRLMAARIATRKAPQVIPG
jgi:glycosyltransferase involved in cell wall biosynthesis